MSQKGPKYTEPRTLVGSAPDTHPLRTLAPPATVGRGLSKTTNTTVRAGQPPKDRSGRKKEGHPDQSSKGKKEDTEEAQWQGETAGATARELRAPAHGGWRTQQPTCIRTHPATSERSRTPPAMRMELFAQTPPAQCCPQATQNRFQPLSHVHTLAKDSGIPHATRKKRHSARTPTHSPWQLDSTTLLHTTHTNNTSHHLLHLCVSSLPLSPHSVFSFSLFLLFPFPHM